MVKVSLGYKQWMEYYPDGTIVFCDDVTLVRKIFTPIVYSGPEEVQKVKAMMDATRFAAEQVRKGYASQVAYAF